MFGWCVSASLTPSVGWCLVCGVRKSERPREHDACVVEDFLQAVADDNELPTGSELSDDSDDSGKPDQGEGRGAEDAGREENAAPKWLMLQGVNPNPNPNPKLHQKAVVYGILP